MSFVLLFAGSSAKAAGTNDQDAAAPATAPSAATTPAPASTTAPATATTAAAAPATPAEARVESELQHLRYLLEAQGKQFQEQNERLNEQLKGEEEKTRGWMNNSAQ
jgi:hypothetical protein